MFSPFKDGERVVAAKKQIQNRRKRGRFNTNYLCLDNLK